MNVNKQRKVAKIIATSILLIILFFFVLGILFTINHLKERRAEKIEQIRLDAYNDGIVSAINSLFNYIDEEGVVEIHLGDESKVLAEYKHE